MSGDFLRWFSSYINRRTQAVVVSNYMSSWVPVPSGVPQGSLLGPLLFAIFTNDISECFKNSRLLCFADDMKVISHINSQCDVNKLQDDLNRLDKYCYDNKLELNPAKCSVVSFSRKKHSFQSSYILKNEVLQRGFVVRDLGVFHDSKLVFDMHVDYIVKKASKSLGFVLRTCGSFTKAKSFKILYCTLVRSILEYASQIWNPRYEKYVARIERIQIKFVKHLCYKLKIPYDSRNYINLCKQFHILPLSKRREIADVTYLLNIMSSKIDCPDLLSKFSLYTPSKPLRYSPLIDLPTATTNYRQNAFTLRASRLFNSLDRRGLDIDLFCTSVPAARRLLSKDFFTS